jgi:flagellar basal-body rod modification protein FlgD
MPDISSSTFLNQVQVPAAGIATAATAASASSSSSGAVGGTKQMGQQDFLKLLLAQMQNQDPMQPMDDTQMMSQMAQFSALEATQQLQATIQQSSNMQAVFQAGALIGKYVEANQSDGSDISGAVTGVDFTSTNGVVSPTLQIDGKDIDYSTIVKVSSTPITSSTPSSSGTSSTTGSATGTPSTSSTTASAPSASTSTTTTPGSAG